MIAISVLMAAKQCLPAVERIGQPGTTRRSAHVAGDVGQQPHDQRSPDLRIGIALIVPCNVPASIGVAERMATCPSLPISKTCNAFADR